MNFKRRLIGFMGSGTLLTAALFACGCGEKALTTQPPIQGPSTISMEVTLTRSNPPAGAKHAALASVTVRETGGRAVRLVSLHASSDYGYTVVQVGGFTPVALAAGQSATFTVTLTADTDIDCSDKVYFAVFTSDQAPASTSVGCETADWPF